MDLVHPLRTGVDYDVRCRVERVTRKRGSRTGAFDLATVEIGLDGPDGVRHATVRPTYVFPRRAEPADPPPSRPVPHDPASHAPASQRSGAACGERSGVPDVLTGVRSGDLGPVTQGDVLPELVAESVDPQRCKTMAALLGDPNMIHLDPAETARLGMGDRVVNQGPINLGYVQTMLAAFAGGLGRVRATSFRFLAPVHAGDRVVAGGRVTAVRRDATGSEIDCEVWLDVTGGARALSGTATLLL